MPNGTYTLSKLKNATGIADDRLSAHHPNGAGNTTSLGDFAVENIGWDSDADTLIENLQFPSNSIYKLPCVEVNGSDSDAAGSYNDSVWEFSNSSVELSPNFRNSLKLRVDVEALLGFGDFFVDQIFSDTANWTFSGGNLAFNTLTKVDDSTLEIEIDVTDFGSVATFEAVFADGLNDAMPHYNETLGFQTSEIRSPTPVICGPGTSIFFENEKNSDGTHKYHINFSRSTSNVLFDPAGQVSTPVTWKLTKNGALERTSSPDPEFEIRRQFKREGGDTWKFVAEDSEGNVIDAVLWRWGDNNAPYDTGGDPATGTFSDRSQRAPAGESNPATLNITSYTPDDSNANI